MSLDALRYVAEKCRHERVGGSAKNLLWVLAYLVPKGEKETPAIWLPTLTDMTGDDVRTVQRAREVLCSPDVGELKIHAAAAKRAVYELAKFAVQGELFGLRTPGHDDSRQHVNVTQSAPTHHVRLTRSITSNCRDVASDCRDATPPLYVPTLEEVPTDYSEQRDAARAPSVERIEAAHSFLDAFVAEFARHKGGATYTSSESDLGIVLELLAGRQGRPGRSVSRLLDMARLMWTLTPDQNPNSDRSFIATAPDQGIRLLRHRGNYLDQQVVSLAGVARQRPPGCRHAPPCVDEVACTSQRLADRHAEYEEIRREQATAPGRAL